MNDELDPKYFPDLKENEILYIRNNTGLFLDTNSVEYYQRDVINVRAIHLVDTMSDSLREMAEK